MNRKLLVRVLLFGTLVLLGAQSALADNVYATIRGTVADQTGAVVQGAQITATNTATGVVYNAKSQDSGLFEFLQLPIGTYTVSVSKQGFKGFKSVGVTLTVNQVYDLPIKLAVGTANETVEVRANAVQVETTDIQQKTVVNSNQIVDLPLIGRNFTQLEQLAPGVMSSNDRFGTFSVNGSQTQQSSYLVNGTDSNDIALNTPGILPSPDAIQEFNLISSTINPEYGRNSGGIVNALIKNGTNQWHGNVFEFYRDTFLNTRNFFSVGPLQPLFHQNLFGGTLGGPVHKDKTFFFLSYQGIRNAVASNAAGAAGPQTDTVFSNAERNGNLSEAFFTGTSTAARMLRNARTTPVPLVGDDGLTHPAGTPWMGSGTTGAIFNCGAVVPTTGSLAGFTCPNALFGHLPTSDFNPVAVNLMNAFVPGPNSAGNQFGFTPTNTAITHQGIARVDHNLTASDTMWGVVIFNQSSATQGLPFTGATLLGFGSHSTTGTKEFTVSENHTFNNTTLNEFRLGYFRLNFDAVEPNHLIQPSSFGFTGIVPANPAAAQLPVVNITGFFSLGFSSNGPQPRKDQNYQLTDNFTKIVGKHSLKFGFDARRFQVDNPFNPRVNGQFDFGGNNSRSTRNPGFDFLFGAPDDYIQGSEASINARAYEYYSYAQDQWKVRSNLTLTLGAGWEIDTPYQNNQFNGLAYNCVIPNQQSTVFPTAPLGLDFPGDKGCTNSGVAIKYGHIGPRVGFAYSPHLARISGVGDKLSVRGGFGIYYNRFEEETALQNLGAPPFGITSFGALDQGFRNGFANPFATPLGVQVEPNKFPFTPPAPGSAVDFGFFEPLSINTNNRNLSTPYSMNFNLNIQREFAGNTVVSLGYVGALGRHLYRAYEGNPNAVGGATGNPAFPAPPVNPAVFASVGTQFTDGTSNYNAMQVNVTKGMTHGLQLITSYTWSHSIDNGSGFENSGFGVRDINPFLPNLNVGDSAQDARQRLVIGYVYAIPNLHKTMNWAPDRIFGGWKMTGITTFQTGFPFNITDSAPTSGTCDPNFAFYGCWEAPNQVASSVKFLNPRNSSFNGLQNFWFDPSSFAPAAAGTFGNTGRSSVHGPGINNFDYSLQKDTKITERMSFQMGIEAFNLFNHTQFNNPQGNVESANFGRITSAASGRLVQLRAKITF
jgi:Carboxypeptidase regulatory-like domain